MSGRVATSRSNPRPGTHSRSSAATRRIAQAVQEGVDVVLQPIVDLASGEVVGVEALARFSDGRSPDRWFAEAASVGLGTALELAAVQAALARIDELPSTASLNVNVSAATAGADALAAMLETVPAGRVVLEITEHVPVTDYPGLGAALARLRARGVRLAIDDAGAGFASLHHVLELKPDVVKLDASLVRGIDSKAEHRALVSALVSFAKETSCALIAEGIETAGELAAAREVGVGCAQGFHLGMPDAAGPERWQVTLPRRPHRLKASIRGAGRFVRPAAIFVAAAMSWQGVVAVAGFEGSRAGSRAESPPAATAPVSGVSGAVRSEEQPATAFTSVVEPTARKAEERRPPAAQPSPSRAAPPSSPKKEGPVAGVVQTVSDVTTGVTETLTDVTAGLTEGVSNTLGGLLRGVLGTGN